MDDYIVCGNCKYNTPCVLGFTGRIIWVCNNENADNYNLPTCVNDKCVDGEEKGNQ